MLVMVNRKTRDSLGRGKLEVVVLSRKLGQFLERCSFKYSLVPSVLYFFDVCQFDFEFDLNDGTLFGFGVWCLVKGAHELYTTNSAKARKRNLCD